MCIMLTSTAIINYLNWAFYTIVTYTTNTLYGQYIILHKVINKG